MDKVKKRIAALLCAALILLSVFTNTGLYVRAQEVDYLNEGGTIEITKDTGNSDYSVIDSDNTVTGISGAAYDNGLRVVLTRDCDSGVSFVALTFDVENQAEKFSGYIDLDEESENDGNFKVKLEVFADETVVYTVTLTEETQFPIKVDATVSGAEKVTARFGDVSANEGETAFILGNVALCESGGTVGTVTIPERSDEEEEAEEETEETEDTEEETEETEEDTETESTTDLSADAEELLSRSTEYLGHNYLYVTMQISWDQAATWCEMQGGYLATIGSETENKFLADYLRSLGDKTAYFGMTNSVGGDFKWQNGETATYLNWARHSSDISGVAYMKMGGGSDEWTVGNADEEYLCFVIEWGEKSALSEDYGDSADSVIIVIPGIGGSDLSATDADGVWAEESGTYTVLDIDSVAPDSEVATSGSEYGTADTYKELMESIGKVCSGSDVVLYEWDWRGSAEMGAAGLGELIEDGGWSDVSLVCHNTGGLVACYYIAENGTDGISKLVTLGTPFYGTEKAFCMMETGMLAQGANSVRGELSESVSQLEALAALVPLEPEVGTVGFTGKMTSTLSREELLEAVGADTDISPDSETLEDVYELIENGGFGGAYIIAGIGTATVEAAAYEEDGITRIYTSLDGDGLTNADSAAMNYRSARPPYIVENADAVGLVTDEDSITLVCNILSGMGDTSGYADGVSKKVYRSAQSGGKPIEISVSGDARLTVQSEGQTTVLSDNGYYFSGGSQGALIYGDVKTIFAAEDAQITIEILGDDVYFSVSGESFTRTWSDISLGAGSVLKTTADSRVLKVTTDGGNSGITEIEADAVPEPEFMPALEDVAAEEEDNRLVVTWNIWAAIGLLVAAAAVAFILMPYFAYRVSKVETDRKKRALKRSLRQRKQAAKAQGTAAPGLSITGMPALPPASDDTVSIDINDVLSGDAAVDFEFLSRN